MHEHESTERVAKSGVRQFHWRNASFHQTVMVRNRKPLAIAAVCLIAGGFALLHFRGQGPDASNQSSNARQATGDPLPVSSPERAPTSDKPVGAPPPRRGPVAPPKTPLITSQRFALATNYKVLYDELSQQQDQTGESRYFMGKAVHACYLFTSFTLDQHLTTMPPGSPNYATKMDAFKEMAEQCKGFYGFKGPGAMQLWREAAGKGYEPAVAATLHELDRSKAEAATAAILERGDPIALERLLIHLQAKAPSLAVEVDGQRASPQVASEAWRLYACSRGADCSAFLFERCWAAAECGAPNFQTYLGTYKPQIASAVGRFEAEIARAVAARDWRALGIVH